MLNVKLLFDTFVPDAVLKEFYAFVHHCPRRSNSLSFQNVSAHSHPVRKQFCHRDHPRPHQITGGHDRREGALVHVADGWVARNFDQLQLAESEEMKQDRAYLEKRRAELSGEGFSCNAVLALGEPSAEIIKLARRAEISNLIAMTTHGHRLISDLLHGGAADKVRHEVDIPVLLLKAKK